MSDEVTIIGDTSVDGNRVTIDYIMVEASHEKRYRLAYKLVQRNGVACRIAALERAPFTSPSLMIATLEAVVDVPGLDFLDPTLTAPEDAGASITRMLLGLAGRAVLNR